MGESINEKKEKITLKVRNAAGWIAGAAVGAYTGINLLLPLFATSGVWWSSKKLLTGEKKLIIPALSVNAGHFLWLSAGILLIGVSGANIAEALIYASGLLWLVKKPSAGPLYLLGTYQALSLMINADAFADAAVGSAGHKALLVHLIWRAMALFFMVKLFLALRQKESQTNAS